MDSDEELRLMNEAEHLQSQLKQAGDPVEQSYSDFFAKYLALFSTPTMAAHIKGTRR
jgi:hypothetical protein